MKKILILTTTIAIPALACLCSGSISSAYERLKSKIVPAINTQTGIIQSSLIPQVKKNIALLEDENKQLEILINQEKDIALKNRELVFELKKKNRLL